MGAEAPVHSFPGKPLPEVTDSRFWLVPPGLRWPGSSGSGRIRLAWDGPLGYARDQARACLELPPNAVLLPRPRGYEPIS